MMLVRGILRALGFEAETAAWLAAMLRGRRALLAGFVALVCTSALVGAVPAFVIRHVIDTVIPSADGGALARAVAVLLVLAVVMPLLGLARSVISFAVGEGISKDLREQLFAHALGLRLETFLHTPTGAFVSRLYGDTQAIRMAVADTVATVLSNLLSILVLAGALLGVEWRLAVVLLPLLPVVALAARLMMAKAEAISRRDFSLMSQLLSRIAEVLAYSGAAHVRLHGRTRQEVEALSRTGEQLLRHGSKKAAWFGAHQSLSVATGMVLVALAYLAGGLFAIQGTITIGSIVATVTLVTQLQSPLSELAGMRLRLAEARMAAARCRELLGREPAEALGSGVPAGIEPVGDVDPEALAGRVDFEAVTLTYAGTEAAFRHEGIPDPEEQAPFEALRGITMSLPAQSAVAFVGRSGSGKSSAANLIARLYVPTSGVVRIDGTDVAAIPREALARLVAIVSQSVYFFDGTIADNLRDGRPGATQEEMLEACERAEARALIEGLPDGLATSMGQVGQRFSAGERQRLALARALLGAPRILILDEVTANVDAHIRNAVLEVLERHLPTTTRVIITHDVTGLAWCDRIFMFEDGRVVEEGEPAVLEAAGQGYARLLRAAEGYREGLRPG